MNIGSKSGYPASSLSNFSPHPFTFTWEGVSLQVSSMEGLLQSFKFKNHEMQREVCKLVGLAAKRKGQKKNWKRTQTLWWQGNPIPRLSQEYQDMLDAAYTQMYEQSQSFRKALKASGNGSLTHTIGKRKPSDTCLTTSEFCGRLMKLRQFGTLIEEENET